MICLKTVRCRREQKPNRRPAYIRGRQNRVRLTPVEGQAAVVPLNWPSEQSGLVASGLPQRVGPTHPDLHQRWDIAPDRCETEKWRRRANALHTGQYPGRFPARLLHRQGLRRCSQGLRTVRIARCTALLYGGSFSRDEKRQKRKQDRDVYHRAAPRWSALFPPMRRQYLGILYSRQGRGPDRINTLFLYKNKYCLGRQCLRALKMGGNIDGWSSLRSR